PLQDVKALLAAQLLQRAPPLVLRLVLGEEPLLRQREVQVEDHEVRQLRLAGQRLRGLAVVVRALERAAAIALLANLAGDAAPAPGDGLELRQVAVDHFHRLVAIVDDEQPGHAVTPLPGFVPDRRTRARCGALRREPQASSADPPRARSPRPPPAGPPCRTRRALPAAARAPRRGGAPTAPWLSRRGRLRRAGRRARAGAAADRPAPARATRRAGPARARRRASPGRGASGTARGAYLHSIERSRASKRCCPAAADQAVAMGVVTSVVADAAVRTGQPDPVLRRAEVPCRARVAPVGRPGGVRQAAVVGHERVDGLV